MIRQKHYAHCRCGSLTVYLLAAVVYGGDVTDDGEYDAGEVHGENYTKHSATIHPKYPRGYLRTWAYCGIIHTRKANNGNWRNNMKINIIVSRMLFTTTVVAACASLPLCAQAVNPNIWWVDDANYGAPGRDGSEAHPFGSIHEAITNEACVTGDTIKVKPGIYDKDYDERMVRVNNVDYQMRTRVCITKKVNIIASGTKEETHIVGRFSPANEGGHATYLCGPTAVRCVWVSADGRGSTLTGFTLRDSATINPSATVSKADNSYNCGGAVAVLDYGRDFYVTDCVISNSIARFWGGMSYGGTFNRCLVYNCKAGGARGSALYRTSAINSVFTHCRTMATSSDTYTLSWNTTDILVNCTIYGNEDAKVETTDCYNCLFVGNASEEVTDETVAAANVYASQGREYANAEPFQLFAPAFGDYHPLPSSSVIGAGDSSKLSKISLPSGVEYRDMDGELIDTSIGHIAAGAYQSVKTPLYGGVMITGNVTVDGFDTYGSNLFYAASWPASFKVGLPLNSVFRLDVLGASTSDIHSRIAGKDGYVAITPPYSVGAIQTNVCVAPAYIRYVDGVNGSDDNSGQSWAKAYKTLQRHIDLASNGDPRLLIVAEGDYCTGGGENRGVSNRVNCTELRWIKFVAYGDPAKTIIRGAAAKNERDPVNYPGCGPDAVRCVSTSKGGESSLHGLAFVGFTIADGHTDVGQSSLNDTCGAGFGRAGGYDSLQFIDCIFTNCYAPAAGVTRRAHLTRCRFIDCGSSADGFRDSVLSAVVVEKGRFGAGVFGQGVRAVGCSVADSNVFVDSASEQIAINCALGRSGVLPASAATWGSTAHSRFYDVANGDLRVRSSSSALDIRQRVYPSQGDDGWDDFAKYFSYYASDSIDGKPWVFSGVYPIAGAYMEWVDVPDPGLILTFK